MEQQLSQRVQSVRARAADTGKFVDRSGKNSRWPAVTAGCPAGLRTASKTELVRELAQYQAIRTRLEGSAGAATSAKSARAKEMRAKQDRRVDERVAALQQIIVEWAQRRRLIEPSLYGDVAARMFELTGEIFSTSTLYIEPYRTVLRGGEVNRASYEVRVRNRLNRHTRRRLMQLIAVEITAIAQLREARRARLACEDVCQGAIAQFSEQFPGRWLKRPVTRAE